MKTLSLTALAAACLLGAALNLNAQSATAFNYQGRLDQAGAPAHGVFEFQFGLWDAASEGAQVAGPLLVAPVTVSNGLFTVSLDYGGDAFNGDARWLEIGVRTNGSGTFTTLAPRQPVSPTPYALHAATAHGVAAAAIGTSSLQNGSVTGPKIGDGQVVRSVNGIQDAVTLVGSGSLNVTADPANHQVVLSAPALNNTWLIGGNDVWTDPVFGPTNAFSLDVNLWGGRALRLENYWYSASPNVIGGYAGNQVAAYVEGAFIGGGGSSNGINQVTASYGAVAGGQGNTAGQYSFVGGGLGNQAQGFLAAIAGGDRNEVAAGGLGFIGAGRSNVVTADFAGVVAGQENRAGGDKSFIGGGLRNTNDGVHASITGGNDNRATGFSSFIGGGQNNRAENSRAAVVGGTDNRAAGSMSTVLGGSGNVAEGTFSLVAGGSPNKASGTSAVALGGSGNQAMGDGSFAAGQSAHALHPWSFVWNGNPGAVTSSIPEEIYFGGSQFTYTANPTIPFAPGYNFRVGGNAHVAGNIKAQGFIGDGSQLTGITSENAQNAFWAQFAGSATIATDAQNAQTAQNAQNAAQLGGRPAAEFALLGSNNVFTGSHTLLGAVTATNAGNTFAGAFAGDGAGLTNLSVAAADLTGTIPDARLSGNVALLNGNAAFAGEVSAPYLTSSFFTGNGAGLSNLSSAALRGDLHVEGGFIERIGGAVNGGNAMDVAISGQYAYLANGSDGVRIYDLLAMGGPSNVGRAFVFNMGYAEGVAVLGDTLYLANREDGLRLFDIADKASPTNIGHLSHGGWASAVAVAGTQAYVANGADGLRVYDVSNPAAPAALAHHNPGGFAGDVCLDPPHLPAHAYVAAGASGLCIYSVADPAHPTNLACVVTVGDAHAVRVHGGYAYVATQAGLEIFDVRDPAQPLGAGQAWGGLGTGVAVVGQHAYLTSYNYQGGRLDAFDVASPGNPVPVASYAHYLPLRGVAVEPASQLLYVAGDQSGLHVLHAVYMGVAAAPAFRGDGRLLTSLDASQLVQGTVQDSLLTPNIARLNSSPVFQGTVQAQGFAGGRIEGHSFAGNGGELTNLASTSLTGPLSVRRGVIARVGQWLLAGNATALTMTENHLYLANGHDGLRTFDLSTPANPAPAGHLPSGGQFVADVAVAGDHAFLAATTGGLLVARVADPAAPVLVGGRNDGGSAQGVAVAGAYAYLANGMDGLRVYDISNPSNVTAVAHAQPGGMAWGLALFPSNAPTHLCLANGEDGVRIYDISTPSSPALAAHLTNMAEAYDVSLHGSFAYVSAYDGIHVINLANPLQPVMNSHLVWLVARSMAVSGGWGIGGGEDYQGGWLRVCDMSNPAQPVELAMDRTIRESARGLAIRGEFAYVAASTEGLQVYTTRHVGGVAAAPGFQGDGSLLTSLHAGAVDSGTLDDARLSANIARLDAGQTFTGSNTFDGALVATNGSNRIAGAFVGDGAGLTNVNALTLAGRPASSFASNVFTLVVEAEGIGAGTITSSPGGISCGTNCAASFAPGTVVTLTATPAADSLFVGWTGACAGTNGVVTMDGPKHVKAVFQKKTYALTVSQVGGGVVSSQPSGLFCGASCMASFEAATTVTLTANPDPGYTFAGWGGAATGTGLGIITMDGAKSVTATFAAQTCVLTVTRAGAGSGAVSSSPTGIDCGITCAASFNWGTVVSLTALPSAGSVFTGWSGASSSASPTILVTLDQARSVTATFAKQNYTLTVARAGSGGGTVVSTPAGLNCGATCAASYAAGTSVTLTATPDATSTFTGWSGAASGGSSTCNVTLDGAKDVTATFTRNTYTLTATRTAGGTVVSQPDGLNCGGDCSGVFDAGTTVTVTALPDPGYTFAGWSGAAASCGTSPTCILTLDSAKSVHATFTGGPVFPGTVTASNFVGSGAGLTNLNAASLAGPLDDARLSANVALLNSSPTFTGTLTASQLQGDGAGLTNVNALTLAGRPASSFASNVFTLVVEAEGNGSGVITSSPGGISCGTNCAASFAPGTVVTLTATPAADSLFVGWSGACAGTNGMVTMDGPKHVKAMFQKKTYALTVTRTQGGVVVSSAGGLNCGAVCQANLDAGATVTLTAMADPGGTFAGWTGAGSGTGLVSLTMDAAKSVGAVFRFPLNVTKTGTGAGTVTSSPAGINCGATCSASMDGGTVVALTATPDSTSVFAGWSGSVSSASATLAVTMDQARSLTATFTRVYHTLKVTKTGSGGGTVMSSPAGVNCGSTCEGSYQTGTFVTLTATPDATSTFAGWSGAASGGSSTCNVTLDGAKDVTATFTRNTYTLTVSRNAGGTVVSQPDGLYCGADCTGVFDAGTAVTLTANPEPGYTFLGWSGGGTTGTGSAVVTMDISKTVTAMFSGGPVFAGTLTASNFVGSAAGLTNLNATNLVGTLADARLSTNVALLNSSPAFAGTVSASAFAGSGANLTQLSASQLASGTVPQALLPAAVVTNGASAVSLTGSFAGNAAGLTGVNPEAVGPAGTFQRASLDFRVARIPTPGSFPRTVALADFNRDGRMDVAMAADAVKVFTQTDSGTFPFGFSVAAGAGPQWLLATDLNGDGWPDATMANWSDGTLTVMTNARNGGLAVACNPSIGGGSAVHVAVVDLNRDGRMELVGVNYYPSQLCVLTNNGADVFSVSATHGLPSDPYAVAVADFNNDHWLDLASVSRSAGTFTVLTNNGGGGLSQAVVCDAGPVAQFLVAVDVNRDGWVDLVSANQVSRITVQTNNRSGGFALADPIALADNPCFIASADFNSDGWPDLAASLYNTGQMAVLTNNQSGGFVLAATIPLGARPYSVVADDWNGDGAPDLASASDADSSLILLARKPLVSALLAGAFTGDGASLTNLNASSLTGTLSDDRLSTNVALLGGANRFHGTNTFTGTALLTNANNVVKGSFTGDGAGLTNLNASRLASGTVPQALLPAAVLTNGAPAVSLTGAFTGDGAGLTNLNAATSLINGSITSAKIGTAAIANTNLAGDSVNSSKLLSDAASLTKVSGGAVAVSGGSVSLATNVLMNDRDIQFRGDLLHGLGWYGNPKFYAGVNVNGPVLYGNGGGALGTKSGSVTNIVLLWNSAGQVGIGTNNPSSALEVNGTVTASAASLAGDVRVKGLIRAGVETNTEPPSPAGLVVRRVNSISQTAGHVIARTDTLTLERDGTAGGFLIRYPTNENRYSIACQGLSSNGTPVNYYYAFQNPGTNGVLQIYSNAQNVVHFRCAFGVTYSLGQHLTEVTLTRYGADNYWSGTITSTYNQ